MNLGKQVGRSEYSHDAVPPKVLQIPILFTRNVLRQHFQKQTFSIEIILQLAILSNLTWTRTIVKKTFLKKVMLEIEPKEIYWKKFQRQAGIWVLFMRFLC